MYNAIEPPGKTTYITSIDVKNDHSKGTLDMPLNLEKAMLDSQQYHFHLYRSLI